MSLLLASAARATVGARSGQEDAFALWPADGVTRPKEAGEGLLAVLADGMGGHAGGAVAGETACAMFAEAFAAAETPYEERYTDNDSWSTNEVSLDWQAATLYARLAHIDLFPVHPKHHMPRMAAEMPDVDALSQMPASARRRVGMRVAVTCIGSLENNGAELPAHSTKCMRVVSG